VSRLSWRAAAAEIRKRRVQILVDLNGHCGKPQFELLALRPAPVQITCDRRDPNPQSPAPARPAC
jgi:predicted O-linked N-acetylglucosamine transferase (SPINDLY family)